MANLGISKGIDSIPQQQIPDKWTSNWFMNFIRTWLRAADVRNAVSGPGITITGQGIQPATISVGGDSAAISFLKLEGSLAGTPILEVDTSGTTGAQTATFTATNKPGTATTAPGLWLPIICDGSTYYIPLWK